MPVAWTITNPGGAGTATLEAVGLTNLVCNFRIMGVSSARATSARDFDSGASWWSADALVTIFRDGSPYFTGRVQESPKAADGSSETRTLYLVDAWDDLETTIYQEPWSVAATTVLFPRAILGLNSSGTQIKTGAQIGAAVDYAISRGVSLTKGSIDTGIQLWPTEVNNVSCDAVITGEMRFHPDWSARIDHSSSPPVFSALAKSNLSNTTVNVNDGNVENFSFAEVVRNVPLGVRIIYNSAAIVDDVVYRSGYLDTAGVTTGRRVMQATLDLKGIQMQTQKSRIQTRTLPTSNSEMTAYFKKKWPELKDMPDGAFEFSNFAAALAPEETHPDPVNPAATRLTVPNVAALPRELVSGSIEDWMRVKVGRIAITYDLKIIGTPTAAQKAILDNFSGTGKSFSVTATDATTKIYKGLAHFDAGESAPEDIAAAVFAAATEDQFEGTVTLTGDDVPSGTYHGNKLILKQGLETLMPGAIIHSVTADIDAGRLTMDFGPLPYLSAGDFLELQRMFRGRPVTWMSGTERSSNELGATAQPSASGDTVGGYDLPITITPPGGSAGTQIIPFRLSVTKDGAEWKWKVSSEYSSITDGTNGTAIDLSSAGFDGAGTTISASKFIVLEAEIDTSLEATSWALAAVDAADAKEVKFDTEEPPAQEKVRLLIGKVTFSGSPAVGTAKQAVFSAQMLTHGLVNGAACKVFADFTTHPDKL